MTAARLNNAALTGGTAPAAVLAAHAKATGEALRTVPVTALTRSPWQPRGAVDTASPDFLALRDSVRDRGILEPLLVREVAGGALELLAGERRLEAARAAGLATVPVRVLTGLDDLAAREVATVENLARSDLTAWEEAQALAGLAAALEAAGRVASVRSLASLAGRSRSAVHRALTVAETCTDDVHAAAVALVPGGAVPTWDTLPGATLEGIAKGATVADRARLLAIAARAYAPATGTAPTSRPRRTPAPATWTADPGRGRYRVDVRDAAALTPADARQLLHDLTPLVKALRARAATSGGAS
jgi:ParB/RepB/Spo0J family partition protein